MIDLIVHCAGFQMINFNVQMVDFIMQMLDLIVQMVTLIMQVDGAQEAFKQLGQARSSILKTFRE